MVKWYDAPEYHAAAFCVASVDEKVKHTKKKTASYVGGGILAVWW